MFGDQSILNNLPIIYLHREETLMNIDEIAKPFINGATVRKTKLWLINYYYLFNNKSSSTSII